MTTKPENTEEPAAVVGCMRRLVRPDCSNCGQPATYSGCHWEAGAVQICEACRKSHLGEHTNVRVIWPPKYAIALWECKKCGDIFDEDQSSWEDLPGDSGERVIACPKCGANFLDDHEALESFYSLPNANNPSAPK